MAEQPTRSGVDKTPADDPPLVTIFGAGISGLTAAHELIERGFRVQVVEAAQSPLREYECQIGGMAANQLGRVKSDNKDVKSLIARACVPGELAPKKNGAWPGLTALQALAESEVGLGSAREQPVTTTMISSLSTADERILAEARALPMQPVQRRFSVTHRIRFKKNPEPGENWLDYRDDLGRSNREKLAEVIQILIRAYKEYRYDWDLVAKRLGIDEISPGVDRDVLQVYILGFTDADGTAEFNRDIGARWANEVLNALLDLNSDERPADRVPELEGRLWISARGAEEPLGDQLVPSNRERSNRVEFRIVGQRIPGEHGYRFFPGFYRHVFDTMRRTPIFDKRGDLTPETAFNQLVATPDPSIGFATGEGLIPLKLTRFSSLKDLGKIVRTFKERAKFTDKDLLRLNTCFLKFLTSCKRRRAKEGEDVSFWEYIGAERVKYSTAAENFLQATPQALVAMSAQETDARSQYDILIQLLLQNPLEPPSPDMTLNGSTSEAWLGHWKSYLKRKGAQFYCGRLTGLTLNAAGDELIPIVAGPPGTKWHADAPIPEDHTKEEPKPAFAFSESDFFVLATPFEETSRLVWDAYAKAKRDGKADKVGGSFSPFRQLMQFDIVAKRRTPDGEAIGRERDPKTGRPKNKSDPLRDISGIQYFMPNNYRFSDGHVYYPDSPWALSSISQLAFWRERIDPVGKYIGQNSFDIGNWYKGGMTRIESEKEGPTAWNSTRQELAENTYEQAIATINKAAAKVIVPPQYYHLDQGIRFVIGPERNGEHIETTATFRGNVLVEVLDFAAEKDFQLQFASEDRGRIPVEHRTGLAVLNIAEEKAKLRDALVEKINGRPEKVVLAVRVPGKMSDIVPARLLISPIVTTSRAVIRITGQSQQPFTILLDGETFTSDPAHNELPAKQLLRAMQERLPHQVEGPDESTITVHSRMTPTRRETGDLSVAVANADNCIELLGSPRLTVFLRSPTDAGGRPLAKIPSETLAHALVMENANPYIINVPGQWRYRPGLLNGMIWYASENDSLMRRWVPAGTYMATHTRITTMEAANESGRHAVNAILHKILVPPKKDEAPLFRRQGSLVGDFCKIWDPEENELPDLDIFKQLDEALLQEGLPHVIDILRVTDLLEALPDDTSLTDALRQIRTIVERQLASSTTASLKGLDVLEKAIRSYCESLREIFSGDGFHVPI